MSTWGMIETDASGDLAGRRLGGRSVLEWIVRRTSDCLRLERIVVVPTERCGVLSLARLAPPDVRVIDHSGQDLLATYADVVRKSSIDAIVRIRAATPFVDVDLIDRLDRAAHTRVGADLLSYCHVHQPYTLLAPLGVTVEWCARQTLLAVDRLAKAPLERRDVTRFVYAHPERFQVELIPAPEALCEPSWQSERGRLDDWDRIHAVCEQLGMEGLDWRGVTACLGQGDGLRRKESRAMSGVCPPA